MKKGTLSSALLEVSGRTSTGNSAVLESTRKNAANKTSSVPSRDGKKAIAAFFDPAVSRQLKKLGLERGDMSVQDLLREALNDLFTKHGHSPIA